MLNSHRRWNFKASKPEKIVRHFCRRLYSPMYLLELRYPYLDRNWQKITETFFQNGPINNKLHLAQKMDWVAYAIVCKLFDCYLVWFPFYKFIYQTNVSAQSISTQKLSTLLLIQLHYDPVEWLYIRYIRIIKVHIINVKDNPIAFKTFRNKAAWSLANFM